MAVAFDFDLVGAAVSAYQLSRAPDLIRDSIANDAHQILHALPADRRESCKGFRFLCFSKGASIVLRVRFDLSAIHGCRTEKPF